MSFQARIFPLSILASVILLPGALCAQVRSVAQKALVSLSHYKPSPQLERLAAEAAFERADIRLSVARLDHSILMDLPANKRPHSTAFLFETTYQGHPEVWAATAGHVAQEGEGLRLTFYDGTKEIPVEGTLVQTGPALLSDAALIRLDTPVPPELRPFALAETINPQEPLVTWGYASNKFYHIENLTFEKDNTRFIRTDFPATQTKRSGLCGGPLLNARQEVLGIHCGSSLEDKAYAANVQILPYLLQAYYEGAADIPVIMNHITFGSIRIDERIFLIQCTDEQKNLLNTLEVYDQLHQSEVLHLLQDPQVRYVKLILGSHLRDKPAYRVLVYDKKTNTHHFEPFNQRRWMFDE